MTSPYNLVFETEPLKKDIIITGSILTRLYMNLNVPDADFEVYIQEVSPDGKDRNIAYCSKRIRYRNGGEHPQLVKPGEIFLLNFDNAFIYAKKIKQREPVAPRVSEYKQPFLGKELWFWWRSKQGKHYRSENDRSNYYDE
jgi:hypothetical protein